MKKKKNYWAFIILALLVGGLGIHEFYREKAALGVFELLFCWTLIPVFVALIEVVVWLFRGEDDFDKEYNTSTEEN